jgi:class 3 adenylate cyclase
VAFSDCKSAFTAARRIQTDLDRFNREVNRLSMPFRLRIGLHVGQVVGDLDEVEFTEVIDIAAHIQDAAPIAGIAASDAVVASLVEDEFVPLAKEIDGHKVHLALNPTED